MTIVEVGDPILVDESLEQIVPESIHPGDIVGISVHTGNALRGYQVGRMARARGAWVVYGPRVATKTISIETDAYDLLVKNKRRTESFSEVIRRLIAERSALAAGDLLDVMQEFRGKGAGARRKRR